jgi:uncharacterized protein
MQPKIDYKFIKITPVTTDEIGTFTGYAALFNELDSYGDTIVKGAFATFLKSNPQVPILWQHDPKSPIGKSILLAEDDKGLKIEAKLTLGADKAKTAHALMKDEAVLGLSIGYYARKSTFDEKTGIRTLLEIELWEVSIVTFPAQQSAGVQSVKSTLTQREIEQKLTHDAGFSRSFARALMSGGLKHALDTQDAVEDQQENSIMQDADEKALLKSIADFRITFKGQ